MKHVSCEAFRREDHSRDVVGESASWWIGVSMQYLNWCYKIHGSFILLPCIWLNNSLNLRLIRWHINCQRFVINPYWFICKA